MLQLTIRTALAAAAVLAPLTLVAQESPTAGTEPEPNLSLSLNAVETVEGSCVLTLLARNDLGGDITRAVYETVLFSPVGRVERLMLFDMGALPDGRPRVRRFEVPGLACENLGSLLINGAETCEAGALGESACVGVLNLSSDTEIGMDG
jgi:hypothetical protein